MTHFFNNKQVLMENMSFQDLTPRLPLIPGETKTKDFLPLFEMAYKKLTGD